MTDASRIWMPDTFFRNEKIGAFHTILQPNLYIRIYPDGTVLYSIRWSLLPGNAWKFHLICSFLCRVSLTASCSMDLALFPLDEQTCHLYIASCEWSIFYISIFWFSVLHIAVSEGPRPSNTNDKVDIFNIYHSLPRYTWFTWCICHFFYLMPFNPWNDPQNTNPTFFGVI